MLMLVIVIDDYSSYAELAEGLGDLMGVFGFVNLFYALLNAQLLFGDLYNSRMCNALHALPVRRETWFFTHLISGILFSLVPNTVMGLLYMPFLEELWYIALIWLLGVTLSYLFFFGMAVLSALSVGSRFAMAVVYAIINFISLLVCGIVKELYDPLLPGIQIDSEGFLWFFPLARHIDFDFIQTVVKYGPAENVIYEFPAGDFPITVAEVTVTYDGWWYLAVIAAVGIAGIAAGLQLYRRRNLESAGDFIVVPFLAPVFLGLYTLCAGSALLVFFDLFLGDSSLIFLFAGLAIGYFTGQMLLKRTVRIFTGKTFAGFALVAAIMGLSLILTVLDPMSITRWVPEADEVESISVNKSYYRGFTAEEVHDIEDVIAAHQFAVDNRLSEDYDRSYHGQSHRGYSDFTFDYHLKNGKTVTRTYQIPITDYIHGLLNSQLSDPDVVFQADMSDPQKFKDLILYASCSYSDYDDFTDEEISSLVDAILADCEAGHMAQDHTFHESDWVWDISFELMHNRVTNSDENVIEYTRYIGITVYPDAENTVRWLEEHGVTENPKY